ncbi:MAG: ATP-dependent DNA helicase RecG, partial [Nannocystaceae bacterium]
GPKIAQRLAERGVTRVEDLALAIPRGYTDRRSRHPIGELQEGMEATVEGVIRDFRQSWFRGRFNARMVVESPQGADGGSMEAGGLGQRVVTGERVLLSGTVKFFRGAASMVHPEVSHPDAPGPAITVRYPAVEGVPAKTFAKACRGAVAHIGDTLSDPIPDWLVSDRGLPSRLDSLRLLHDPPETLSEEAFGQLVRGTSPAHRRLAFDEFFMLQIAVLRQRQQWKQTSCACPPVSFDRARLRAALPFEPTDAQWRCVSEIEADLGQGDAMLRLLQGDVGSGKTAVAFAAALAVVMGGAQVALMAPTELLADQHYKTLAPWCERAGIRVALLTGSTGRAQRASKLALLEAGKLDLLIGTHALIVDDVRFRQLGLVIVDEQHRFGVEQRTKLREKGRAPHLLVMTATPIPRSLALTAFGELDVSIIDELPPGRVPATTAVFLGKRGLTSARKRLIKHVRDGLQAYVVCPLVEASEAVDASDVEQTARELAALLGDDEGVGLIHGRLPQAEKDEVMGRFREGTLRVLVATTVIEVGVDVPSARVIVVEHAERFGLAQLHQLRGRVGRGQGASHCFLHTGQSKGSDAHQRLLVLEETSDGFEVAERDLKFRGPGEMFGTRQSGAMSLRFAGFGGDGLQMVVDAREAARELLTRAPTLEEYPQLRHELDRRLASEALYSGESG